jgi:hypothetical protein
VKNERLPAIKNAVLTVRANHRSHPGSKKITSLAHKSMKTSAASHESKMLPKITSFVISSL